MAFAGTVTVLENQLNENRLRNKYRARVKVDLDASYDSGGEPIDFTSTAVIDPAFSAVEHVECVTDATGYVAAYDLTNGKLMVHEEEAVAAGGPLVESSGDLSAVDVYLTIWGSE